MQSYVLLDTVESHVIRASGSTCRALEALPSVICIRLSRRVKKGKVDQRLKPSFKYSAEM